MKRPTVAAVLARLEAEGRLGPGEAARLEGRAAPVGEPPYVAALLGFGGWLAALFLLGFLTLFDVVDTSREAVAAGVVAAVAAAALRRASESVFVGQVAFAFSVLATLLVGGGAEDLGGRRGSAAGVLVLEAALLVAYRDPRRRVLSAAAGALALVALALETNVTGATDLTVGVLAVACGVLWLRPEEGGPAAEVRRAVVWGLAAAVLLALLASVVDPAVPEGRVFAGPPATIALTAAVIALALRVASERGSVAPRTWAAVVATLGALGALTLRSPGVVAALGALLLGFRVREAGLVKLAVAFLLAFGVAFYHHLGLTLLAKSAALVGSGLLLLLARAALVGGERRERAGQGLSLPVLAGLALALGAPGVSAWRMERLLDAGEPLFLELAPVDPRSLVQGDYMALRYAIENEAAAGAAGEPRDGHLVVRQDAAGVARFVRLDGGPLAAGERRLRFRRRGGRLRVGPDAFFFQEGHAALYEHARFGRLVADAEGNVLLVGLADADRVPLGPR